MDRQEREELSQFRYDPKNHTYWFRDRRLPSITDLLVEFGIVERRYYKERDAIRGTAFHLAAQYYDEGNLDWKSVAEENYGRMLAYQKFQAETGFKPIRIEEPRHHPILWFAGTPDREGTWNRSERNVVLELKSGPVQRTACAIQTALQDILLPDVYPQRERVGVWLKPDGTYKPEFFEDPVDYEMAKHLISLHWLKERYNIKHGDNYDNRITRNGQEGSGDSEGQQRNDHRSETAGLLDQGRGQS